MALKRNTADVMREHARIQITSAGRLIRFEHFQELAANSGWHDVEYPMSGTANQCRKKMLGVRRYNVIYNNNINKYIIFIILYNYIIYYI